MLHLRISCDTIPRTAKVSDCRVFLPRRGRKTHIYTHWLFDHGQQRRKVVRGRLGDAIDGEVADWAPLVVFDLEDRASATLIFTLALEQGSKVGRVLLQRRLVQLELCVPDLDDDGAVGMPKVWVGLRARARV